MLWMLPRLLWSIRDPRFPVRPPSPIWHCRILHGRLTGPGFLEDTGEAVPPVVLERILCDTGTREITVDGNGNPLDVGREQRLFTIKQKTALAYRDGGCMDPLCDQPTSYTEAHSPPAPPPRRFATRRNGRPWAQTNGQPTTAAPTSPTGYSSAKTVTSASTTKAGKSAATTTPTG
jgi:hypothetical protein